ncbi:MAG: toll/interleukin-1 receptor domain-containing protein, partial [Burkholderiales bacterium]
LFDRLSEHFGRDRVFMDVSGIEPGVDFVEAIEAAVGACEVLVVIVGKDWLKATDASGKRRLENPRDFIRLEIGAALRRELRLIPVLVNDAKMPALDELPEELKPLGERMPIRLSGERWDFDVAKLVRIIQPSVAAGSTYPSIEPIILGESCPPTSCPPAPEMDRSVLGAIIGGVVGATATAIGNVGKALRRKYRSRKTARKREVDSALEHKTEGNSDKTVLFSRSGTPPVFVEPETVLLGVSAPQAVKPGSEFTARFVAYIASCESEARDELRRLSPGSTVHMGLETCQWQRRTSVTVRLVAASLSIEPAEKSFVWQGGRNRVEFDVIVPASAKPGTVVLKFTVLIEALEVARLRLDLQIATTDSTVVAETSATGRAARTAFASYASQDRLRVLDRIAAAAIAAGLDVFLDCLSLRPNEAWKKKLEQEIGNRDLFMLFWSKAASESKWVDWELRTALLKPGLEAIQVHPLELKVPPPEVLKDQHVNDPYIIARTAYSAPGQ